MDIQDVRRVRLRALIDEKFGGTSARLAERIDKQPSYIARIFTSKAEHRRNIGERLARTIEEACGLEPGALDQPFPEKDHSRLKYLSEDLYDPANDSEPVVITLPNAEYMGMISVWDDDTPLDEDEVEVPFLREVELAAGSGKTYIEETTKWKLRFGKFTLRRKGVQPENAVCVVVKGNSMEPVLPDGATVGVDRGATSIIDGKVYALKDDGMLRVKILHRLPGGKVRLRSYNRDEYADEDRDFSSIEVIGRVFWSSVLW
ncbi:helix-turn-helix transcriptional regulator [Pseudomonas sp. GD04087]|uniref:S24 family peptidase n=1 Tax=unclassified Pseudomonas TaxID=196821 RepID=UPI002449F8A3|nr:MULTISPECIES: helix-turn-helix transcriptional regulator [unclassified Pseudomonas]MDH0291420.1 helix-turn-helix transcriptional regulator [Pseudomonas sp. GD04087]MDH1051732.1 helix-turn-helix transcriptional regulator [Pseudomonas sp. GD03903]MDH2001734.1 helix-turn-helix transcriptional regulator [Pseudomonas sp. GD03691]